MKRKPGRPRKLQRNSGSVRAPVRISDPETFVPEGRRGRRSMPAVRVARQRYAKTQREVAQHEKRIRARLVLLAGASGRTERLKAKAAIKTSTAQLKRSRQLLAKVAGVLRHVLAVEAAKSRAMARERALALYKVKLETRLGKDLARAMARFVNAWKAKRNKIVSRKLAARTKKEAVKARIASRKANAKVRESLKRAETLAKARARKAEAKAKAKARKLAAKAKAKARLVVRKAKRRARPVVVRTRRVLPKNRSK